MLPYAKTLFILLTSFAGLSSMAQEKRLVTGRVTDASNGEAIPFANVSLKKQLIGIVTNDAGSFDFYIPEEADADTLMISFFGYRPTLIAVKAVSGPLQVKLQQNALELQEVVVRPLQPQEYIRMAMRRLKINYPTEPFGSEAYYREKATENKSVVKCDEGVFKTYYPNYQDTVKNQHQLLLYRQGEKLSEVQFMKKERDEKAEKEKKTGKKQKNSLDIDLTSSFGGPENILKGASLTRDPAACLDTLHLKSYNYVFAKSSTYNNKELLVIDFDTKGKVNHVREEGKIYIDLATFAIVKLESHGDIVIPVLLRPVIFMYGIGIENPSYQKSLEFQQVKNKWYPKNIQYNVNINLTNRHWFKPNEHSDFVIEGVFTVNKIKIDQPASVPVARRFSPKKEMKDQVFNDDGLSWEGLNIIKK